MDSDRNHIKHVIDSLEDFDADKHTIVDIFTMVDSCNIHVHKRDKQLDMNIPPDYLSIVLEILKTFDITDVMVHSKKNDI